ncbi:hypothetical protein [Chryseobacterium sp.]|uniref:hypothetical protein n=1 Tax=Chryseobacterium sp. TaxID=1871047 RepID=UPI0025BF6757|nr:hypothetical protein [Chryseobacterium sp.]
MSYLNELKPAKVLNLRSLQELNESFFLQRSSDTNYFSMKKPENNLGRIVFGLQTADININPTVRFVNCINKNKRYISYQSFVIEPKDKATGITVVMIKLDDAKNFFCNVRILPLNTLNSIADPEADSKLLTVNLEKAESILKVDITITPSNTGEAMYATHDIDVSSLADLITSQNSIIDLKRELEFEGSKLIAHYCQEILDIVVNENTLNPTLPVLFSEDYVLQLPLDELKELVTAIIITGNISTEIVGSNVIQNINTDWTAASAFIGYMI